MSAASSDLRPSRDDFEVIGAFNPGVSATADGVVLLVRVAERPTERRAGQTGFPRWDTESKSIVTDWMPTMNFYGGRARRAPQKRLADRLTSISHLRVVPSRDGRNVDSVQLPGLSRRTSTRSLALKTRASRGSVSCFTSPTWQSRGTARRRHWPRPRILNHSNVTALYSRRKQGRRAVPGKNRRPISRAAPSQRHDAVYKTGNVERRVARSVALGRACAFLGGSSEWNIGRVGAGPPPIRTPDGWLEIYHGNSQREGDPGIGTYSAGALLLDWRTRAGFSVRMDPFLSRKPNSSARGS